MRKINYPIINQIADLYEDHPTDIRCYYFNISFVFQSPNVWLNQFVKGQIATYCRKEIYMFLEQQHITQYVSYSKWNFYSNNRTCKQLCVEFTTNNTQQEINKILKPLIKNKKINKKIHGFINKYYIYNNYNVYSDSTYNSSRLNSITNFKLYLNVSKKQKNNIINL